MVWRETPTEAAFATPDTGEAKLDMCMYDKRRPNTGEFVKKPLTFKGTRDVCESIKKVCDKTHNHSKIGDDQGKSRGGKTFNEHERMVRWIYQISGGCNLGVIGENLGAAFRYKCQC